MGIRLEKEWIELNEATAHDAPGQLGAYQLADADGTILKIGYAGARSLFGLRSELEAEVAAGVATHFRYEVTTAYLTRYDELLMVHVHDHGARPPECTDPDRSIGRLSPG